MASVVAALHGPDAFGAGPCLQRLHLREAPLAPLGHVPARVLRRRRRLRRRRLRASRRRQVVGLGVREDAALGDKVHNAPQLDGEGLIPAVAPRLSTRSAVCRPLLCRAEALPRNVTYLRVENSIHLFIRRSSVVGRRSSVVGVSVGDCGWK